MKGEDVLKSKEDTEAKEKVEFEHVLENPEGDDFEEQKSHSHRSDYGWACINHGLSMRKPDLNSAA